MYRILSSLLAIVILSIVSWQAFREGNYLGGALAAAGIIGLTGLIFYFINTTNRKLTYFFSALENDDYTIRYAIGTFVKPYPEPDQKHHTEYPDRNTAERTVL